MYLLYHFVALLINQFNVIILILLLNSFWLLVPMPTKLCRYTLSILGNVLDALSHNFSHLTLHFGCKCDTEVKTSADIGQFLKKNFWLLVPMPVKPCGYTLLILCNVFDAKSDNFNHSTPYYGCKCDAQVKSLAGIWQFLK